MSLEAGEGRFTKEGVVGKEKNSRKRPSIGFEKLMLTDGCGRSWLMVIASKDSVHGLWTEYKQLGRSIYSPGKSEEGGRERESKAREGERREGLDRQQGLWKRWKSQLGTEVKE